jgi:predicted RNase H-like nuclease (RuvC/YqgF family)
MMMAQEQERIQLEKDYIFSDWQLAIAEDETNLRRLTDKLVEYVHNVERLTAERDALAGQLEEQGAEIDRLRRAIEDEHGCVPGEFDPFTFHEGPLFEGMP